MEKCMYCGCESVLETVPAVSDDSAWESLAKNHKPGCEWVATRAHRMDRVGDWGWPSGEAGGIFCKPNDREAVQSAYDAIDEGNLRRDTLDDVVAAGGVFIQD